MEASFGRLPDHEKFPFDLSEAQLPDGEEEKRTELVQLLLKSGNMIGEENYDEAAEMVTKCKQLSCQTGNATQRLGYYISTALQERIQLKTLRTLNSTAKVVSNFTDFCTVLAHSNKLLPYVRAAQFTSVQAIIDVVGNAEKIHVIDLWMRTGSNWSVLMEYLAHRSISSDLRALQLLRITVVGMDGEQLLKSGETLHELAESLAIPFSYNTMEIARVEEIKEGFFTVESWQALAVHAPFVLKSLLYDRSLLENLLRVIKKLRPSIMVNVEVEAEHNCPSFADRFSEVLLYYMAYFDMLGLIMTDRSDSRRMKHEELLPGSHIRNMIVYDGNERFVRHAGTDLWRCFFKQAGFAEQSFSFRAMYQAQLLLKECACREHYTLDANGHAIILKWKGTRLFAISAWNAV